MSVNEISHVCLLREYINSIDLFLSIDVSGTINFVFFSLVPAVWGWGCSPKFARCDLWFCPLFYVISRSFVFFAFYFFLFNPLNFISVFLLKNFF